MTASARLVVRSLSMSDEKPSGVRRWTMSVTAEEAAIIDGACEALHGIERSQLVQEAAIAEANRLGLRWSAVQPPPLTQPWVYLPMRGREITSFRLGISVSITVAQLVKRAAEHVRTSEPPFLVGATLAYIGRLQAHFDGSTAEGRKVKAALRKLKLPPQYQSRERPGE